MHLVSYVIWKKMLYELIEEYHYLDLIENFMEEERTFKKN